MDADAWSLVIGFALISATNFGMAAIVKRSKRMTEANRVGQHNPKSLRQCGYVFMAASLVTLIVALIN